MRDHITIRHMQADDCTRVSRAFADQGWHKPVSQFRDYLRQSKEGARTALVAQVDGHISGYVTIVWDSNYPPFQEASIPEVVDLNVLRRYQRQGIGTALLEAAEERVAGHSAAVGIGVGLTEDYGAAQMLYAKRGYVSDGRGIHGHGRRVKAGESIIIEDSVVMYLIKEFQKHS